MSPPGVNRVSLGVQSLDDDRLRALGAHPLRRRGHRFLSPPSGRRLRQHQPGPDVRPPRHGRRVSWHVSSTPCVELNPDHVACYALMFEEGTVFDRRRRAGRLLPLRTGSRSDAVRTRPVSAAGGGVRSLRDLELRPPRSCVPAQPALLGRRRSTSAAGRPPARTGRANVSATCAISTPTAIAWARSSRGGVPGTAGPGGEGPGDPGHGPAAGAAASIGAQFEAWTGYALRTLSGRRGGQPVRPGACWCGRANG